MTDAPSTETRRVYRLLPSLGDFRTLRLRDDTLQGLARWCYQGPPHEPPSVFPAAWVGKRQWRTTEFPTHYAEAPILSRRVADLLRDDLRTAGSLAPVTIDNPVDDTEYVVYVVHAVVDCVDVDRSSPEPVNPTGELERTVFRPDAVPSGLPAFRIPQFPVAVHWNGWAADRLAELLGEDLERRLVWSDDPEAVPHHRPWGI
mgnify:CR=1 FL=1